SRVVRLMIPRMIRDPATAGNCMTKVYSKTVRAWRFSSSHSCRFKLDGSGTAIKPGGGAWAAPSDARLKKNIAPLDGALDRLLQLRSVTFEYKDPAATQQLPGRRTGFIAQEVEGVFPEWVGEQADGMKF